ncbi:hypothetical protein, partial [Bacillus sp. WP8]|uniref:hypothetical protein n=1 Tax=Bacillus sp. WP8 TaxID=756828 RepID=UPI001C92CE52
EKRLKKIEEEGKEVGVGGGEEMAVAKKSGCYEQWGEGVYEYGERDELEEEVGFWENMMSEEEEGCRFERGGVLNIEEDAEMVSIELRKDERDILVREGCEGYGREVKDLVL